MKKIISLFLFVATVSFAQSPLINDITDEIPVLTPEYNGFHKIDNVAQYKNASWDNVIGIAKNISVNEALRIANENPEITFFFYTKGYQMVLETTDGDYRVFHHGDTVFFSGEPWWGSAPGLADGYTKNS